MNSVILGAHLSGQMCNQICLLVRAAAVPKAIGGSSLASSFNIALHPLPCSADNGTRITQL